MRHTAPTTRGFTLIELLIVIAIIGILSAVVLVALNDARGKGTEAAQKRDLIAMRSQAELWVDANGNSFAGLCTGTVTQVNGTKNVYEALLAYGAKYKRTVVVQNNAGGAYDNVVCHSDVDEWVIQTSLVSSASGTGNGRYFCIDSLGQAVSANVTKVAGTGSDFDCK